MRVRFLFALALVPVDLRGQPATSARSSAGEPTTSRPGRPRMSLVLSRLAADTLKARGGDARSVHRSDREGERSVALIREETYDDLPGCASGRRPRWRRSSSARSGPSSSCSWPPSRTATCCSKARPGARRRSSAARSRTCSARPSSASSSRPTRRPPSSWASTRSRPASTSSSPAPSSRTSCSRTRSTARRRAPRPLSSSRCRSAR